MRWFVRLLGVVVSLALLAGLALFLIPTERIAALVAQRFAAETGRDLVIDGAVRPSIYPLIGVRMEQVRLANAAWSDAGPMMRAEVMDVGLDVAALWAGDIVIRRLELQAPDLLLERDAAGRENWAISWGAVTEPVPDAAPDEGRRARALSLDLAEISDGRLRFRDAGTGIDITAEAVSGALRLPGLDREASLRLSGRMNGQPFTVQGRAGQPGALLDGRVSAVVLSGEAAGAGFGFDGRAGGTPLALEGQVDLDLPALGPVMALLGQSAADLPPGVAPLRFTGQVTRAASGTIHARAARLRAGANALSGAADLRLDGMRPQLTAQLTAEPLDLRPMTGAAGAGVGNGGAQGWSRAPLNLAALGALDADVTLSAPSIETGVMRLGPTRLGLRIDNARAVFDLREVRLFDGTLAGEFVLNGRGGGSVGGDLRASEVALLPLLRDLAGFERLQGTGSAQVRFLGVGNSMQAIMSSLSGEGQIDLGEGAILGLDLAGMLRTLDMNYMGEGARTVYDRVTGRFTMDGGVLRNDDLRLEATRLSVAGRGTVGIGERVLNYRITPEAMRDPETGQALRVPLLITGPWHAPRFRLDLEALAEERLREEAARLEELAREEARRREEELRARAERELQERLGVEREEGESLEDAARRRLQDEIGRGLGRLLGGD
ncbi:MAG: AsmA family protein [Rhodobacteraceae bacterium]|nr:AsmA family protein [Paracoccaceae bacterium]